jgi:thiamine monophosphate synthase
MSACAVAATPPARTLRELDLACNAIGERGLAALTAALDSGVLSVHEVLDVSANPAPAEAANMLKSALQAARKRRVERRAAD